MPGTIIPEGVNVAANSLSINALGELCVAGVPQESGAAGVPVKTVRASSNAGQTVTADTEDVQYEDVIENTDSAWDVDHYTAPVPGLYFVGASCDPNSGAGFLGLRINVNGTTLIQGATSASGGLTAAVYGQVWLEAGDVLAIRTSITITRDTAVVTNTIIIQLVAQEAV
jgi:hypothetical protein